MKVVFNVVKLVQIQKKFQKIEKSIQNAAKFVEIV